MLNSLSELSKQTFDDDIGDRVASTNVDVLEPVLEPEEAIRYVMVSTKGIEHTTESRTTTVKPDGDNSTYAVITGHRVLFLVGTNDDDVSVDIEFQMDEVTTANARSGLLSSSLVVTANQTNSVKFIPTSAADPEEVADYIGRMADAWQDLRRSIARAWESIDTFEEHVKAGEDTHEDVQRTRQRLSSAIHAATRNDDGPTEDMMSMVEEVEDELDTLLVRSRMDRVDALVEDAEAAIESGDHRAAIEDVVEAGERLDDARTDLGDVDDPDPEATDAVAERAVAVDAIAGAVLGDHEDTCRAAADADPEAAADLWANAIEWIRTAKEAGWDGPDGVSAEAIEFQEAWLVGRRIDALCEYAAAEEATGDDLGETHEESESHYEAAKAALETARDLATEYPHATTDGFDEAIEAIEEKLEVSEWEWGQA